MISKNFSCRFRMIITLSVIYLIFLFLPNLSFAAFVDNGDGTVTDTATNLMWQKATASQRMTQESGYGYCQNLVLPTGGYTDWYLPSIEQLTSIVNKNYSPTIDPNFFPDTKTDYQYWSSSSENNGWFLLSLNFSNGNKYDNECFDWCCIPDSDCPCDPDPDLCKHYIRCVRNVTQSSNREPQYVSGTISPNPGAYGSSFTFESTWQDPDNDYVVDVKARYRKQGAANWTELPDTLDFVNNTNPPKFTKTVKINGAAGTYEYQFQASDANPAAGARKHITAWQGGGTFAISGGTTLPAVKISVGPKEIPQGFSASIFGENFIANSTAVLHIRKSNGTEYASVNATTDTNGRILSNYSVSLSMPPDTYTCWAADTSSGRNSNEATFTVKSQISPQIQMPMGTQGKPGDSFMINGSGFTPDGNAELRLKNPSGIEGILMTTSVTWEGKFVESYASSYSDSPGTYTLWAIDKSSGKSSPILSFVLVSDTVSGGGFVITSNGGKIGNQAVNTPFTIEVRAVNSSGTTNNMYSKDVSLTSTGIGNISLSKVTLKNGQGSASLKVYSPAKGMKLIANGYGMQGESNLFDVTGGETNTGSISGKVINLKGLTTEENAIVFLNSSGLSLKQTTNTSGRFEFRNLPPGKYTLSAKATDERQSQLIDVPIVNQPFPIDIYLSSKDNPENLTPIILIPGIMGSSTGENTQLPYLPKFLPRDKEWSPPTFGLHDFWLSPSGWGKLIDTLTDPNGEYRYELNKTLFPVPYDWRIDINTAAQYYLKYWIKEAKNRSGIPKVHVIAHSMGGLVTRAYIQSSPPSYTQSDYGYGNDIDKFAMVGTPNQGAGMVYFMVEGGDPRSADYISAHNSLKDKDTVGKWGTLGFMPYETVSRNQCKAFDIQIAESKDDFDLDPATRLAFLNLYLKQMPSARQLMPTYNFLTLNDGTYKDSVFLQEENLFLEQLNNGSWGTGATLNRMGREDEEGKVKTKIFAGTGYHTLKDLGVNISYDAKEFYKDGEPITYTTDDGDGTVLRERTRLENVSVSYFTPEKTGGSHSSLIKVYMDDVLEFITGKRPQTRTTRDNSSTPTNELNISVFGRAVPFVYDPYGKKCGVNPDTDKREDEISGCRLSMNGSGITLRVPNPVNGTYTLYLKDRYAEDFRLMMSYADSQKAANQNYHWFDNAGVISLTFTINTSSDNRMVVNQAISAPTGLQADAVDSSGLKTRLSWSAVSGAASYNVYSKEDGETYFTKLGNVSAGTAYYNTGHLWASNSSVKTRAYVVSAVKSDGTESFLSDTALNNDRDHDGLTDEKEVSLGTNVSNADSDGDGLKDGEEYIHNTNPLVKDTDGDGLSDYQEIMGGSDPLDPNSKPILSTTVRQLPATYQDGKTFTVSITVKPDSDVSMYVVEDQPPQGWIVSGISDNGVFDWVNGKVKFVFFDNQARTLIYQITPTTGSSGIFMGTALFDNISVQITGKSSVNAYIPGDISGDGKVDLADAILGLKVLVGLNPSPLYPANTMSGKVELKDVVFVLQKVSGLR